MIQCLFFSVSHVAFIILYLKGLLLRLYSLSLFSFIDILLHLAVVLLHKHIVAAIHYPAWATHVGLTSKPTGSVYSYKDQPVLLHDEDFQRKEATKLVKKEENLKLIQQHHTLRKKCCYIYSISARRVYFIDSNQYAIDLVAYVSVLIASYFDLIIHMLFAEIL